LGAFLVVALIAFVYALIQQTEAKKQEKWPRSRLYWPRRMPNWRLPKRHERTRKPSSKAAEAEAVKQQNLAERNAAEAKKQQGLAEKMHLKQKERDEAHGMRIALRRMRKLLMPIAKLANEQAARADRESISLMQRLWP